VAAALGIGLVLAATARGEVAVFPADAGVIDVTRAPYGARGDGKADDTAAIQKALDDHPNRGAIIYLPRGTYLLSDTLKWPQGKLAGGEEKNTILQGASRNGTILKLRDACPGFTKAENPRAVVWTGSKPGQRFRNAVRNLTINTGSNNPGAIGLQFIANLQGCVRDVTIRSVDGKARIGLDLAFSEENGPCLVKNVRILGFDLGVRTAHAMNCATFENLELEHQGEFGLVNEGQAVTVRGLTSRNVMTAVVNTGESAHLVLLEANLYGVQKASTRPAVLNEGGVLYARKITTSGYAESIHNSSERVPSERGEVVEEFVSEPVTTLFPTAERSLYLPIKETPEVPWDDLSQWASPTHFGIKPNDGRDATRAIQAAIDSGKSTVYLPNGYYRLSDTIIIRKNVRRIIGCEATIGVPDLKGQPAFKIDEGTSPVVVFERIQAGFGRTPILENATGRTLVVRDCFNVCGVMSGPGDVFLEDVCTNPFTGWRFGRQHVWARQLDVERDGTHILNAGGSLWILGLRTARGGIVVMTTERGSTEVLGGLCDSTGRPKAEPMFTLVDSYLSASLAEHNDDGNPFATLVRESRAGQVKDLSRGDVPKRIRGSGIPLYVGRVIEP
jgi:hypothetical protein